MSRAHDPLDPIYEGRLMLDGELREDYYARRLEDGSMASNGPSGGPSPSGESGVTMVRRHNGQATITVGFLTRFPDVEPATFIVLSEGDGEGEHTCTLSFNLSRADYKSLERALTMPGRSDSVGVKFVPTTPNLVPAIM